jgi:thiol-disulfide isomerase/thioredoxin
VTSDDSSSGQANRAARPYTIVVGCLFLVVLVVAGINAVSNRAPGAGGLSNWEPLPRFAAPAATGGLDGDANVNQDDVDANGKHRVAACDVAGPASQVVRICDFFDRPLVMVAWFTRGCGTCESQLDTVEKVRKRFRDVAFVGLDIASNREDVERKVRENGWRFPMAVDPDGAVSALYRVGGGPMTFFAYPGGIAMDTAFGELDERELVESVRRLLGSAESRWLWP